MGRNDDETLIGAAGFIFQTPVRARKHKPPKDVRRWLEGGDLLPGKKRAAKRIAVRSVRRLVARHPEVMVKVSGKTLGRNHVKEHLAYISRNGKLVLEVSDAMQGDSYVVAGAGDVREIAEEWYARNGADRKICARDTINMVLSMPPGTDRDAVAKAASRFAEREFGGRFDYVLAQHTDTEHPHAHLTVRTRNDLGQYLDPCKEDLQRWREGFAIELRSQNVQAAASPRRARGVVQKATKQSVLHLDARRASKTSRWKVAQAVKTLQGGGGKSPLESWDSAIAGRQKKIRAAWKLVAAALESSGDIGLSMQVRHFIDSMPPVQTKQRQLTERLVAHPSLLRQVQNTLLADDGQQSQQIQHKKR